MLLLSCPIVSCTNNTSLELVITVSYPESDMGHDDSIKTANELLNISQFKSELRFTHNVYIIPSYSLLEGHVLGAMPASYSDHRQLEGTLVHVYSSCFCVLHV